jgi:putative NIF3 family GTP cyclohydrolase 1 type 2
MDVDVLLTGELSHHEVLASIAKGQHVILCGHTNTERGFLAVLQPQLQRELEKEMGPSRVQVKISTTDHDPIEIL